eukprot:6109925-Amphidinium_carterae.1
MENRAGFREAENAQGPGTELGENPTGEYILHYCKPTVAVVPIAAHGAAYPADCGYHPTTKTLKPLNMQTIGP